MKGPAANSTDAPQALGLMCDPVMKMINFFVLSCVMEYRWNEIDGGKPKYLGKYQCHFFYHKCHMDWPGIETWPPR
jgi:hypothetical protein